MKPGPATSTFATRSSARSFAAIASASSRGFLPASLASTMAALVAMSPWAASRGGSTTMRDWSIAGRQHAVRDQRVVGRTDLVENDGEDVLDAFMVGAACVRSRRLTQFRGRVKKPRVLDQRVAVGHAGDEIGDAAQAAGFVPGLDGLRPFGRQVVGFAL